MVKSGTRRALHLQALGRLALLLAIPILVGVVMWLVALQAEGRELLVQHTLQVQLSLERLLSDMKGAESSQRGLLVTGDPEFSDSYHAAVGAADREIAQLARLTADNGGQLQRLARLRPLMESYFAELAAVLADFRSGRAGSTVKLRTTEEHPTVQAIQSLVAEMVEDEARLLRQRKIALDAAETRFLWSLVLGYALIVAVVASLYGSVKHYGTQSAEAEARLAAANAELDERIRQRTALLQAREDLLNIFVQCVPAGVAMLDRNMRYLQLSERWCADYGIDRQESLGRSHYDLFPDLPRRWKEIHSRCLAGETMHNDEDKWEREDGSVTWVRWEIRPWGATPDGLPEGLLVFGENITARKETEEALRESEATNRALLDTASQAVLAVNEGGTIVLANRIVGEMFGYAASDLVGQAHEVLIPQALRERHEAHRAAFAANPRPRAMGMGMDLIGLRKDGTEFPIEVSLSSVATTRGLLAVSFVSDISARKKAELDLRESEQKMRALAGSLLTAQEEERSRLARELHDDLTQQLALFSIELGRLANDLPNSQNDARTRVQSLQQQALRASSEVRRLSHGLHPSVIADFGLSVALEEFCDEFEKAHGIRIEFEGLIDDSQLDDAGATCLYRVAQESMRNAAVHGRASRIHVSLEASDRSIQLRVADDGVGFSADPARSKAGLGIVSMKERTRLVNGTMNLTSGPGAGTVVTATVPLTRGRK